jgi:predicted nucleic acid-binding protein
MFRMSESALMCLLKLSLSLARKRGADSRCRLECADSLGARADPQRDRADGRARGACASGVSDLEVGYSARSAAEWDQLAEALAVFELVETTADHVRRARQVQRLLASKHQRGRKIPDLLIAAAAEARNLGVLHYDADPDRIAAVTGQPCQWVVPAGSVD